MRLESSAAYVAWILALVAILMPPAFADTGIKVAAGLGETIFASVEDAPEPLTVAGLRAAEPGWQG